MKVALLKRLATIEAGQSPPSEEVSDFDGEGLPFLQGNAEFGLENPTPQHRCDSAPRQISAGDILLSVRAPVGALNIADRAYGIGRGLAAIRPIVGRIHPRFLWWLLHSLVPALQSVSSGSTYDAVSAEDIGALAVQILPLEREQVIADFLDRETARIEALISARRKMGELTLEREAAALSAVLVPAGATYARLGFFARLQTGLTVDAGRESGPNPVTLPYLRVANVQADRLDLTEITQITVPAALAARSTLRQGDVLMTEGGDLDKLGRGTMWRGELPGCLHQNHIFAVRPDPECLNAEYLSLLTRTAHARQYFESTGTRTTNLASTNSTKILGLPIPAITVEEQRRLVKVAEVALMQTQRLRASLERQIELLREHRQALVTAAVTGAIEGAGVAA